MVVKKRTSLGRGLDKLLSSNAFSSYETATLESEPLKSTNTANDLCHLPVDVIQRGAYQPRRDMDREALEDLANSIRSQGVLQPIVVRPIANNRYELIAGERRWRAAQMAKLTTIPAIVKTVSDEDTMAIALIENIQRENLNPIEEAMAISRLMDEFGMTHQQIAQTLGKSRTTVSNLLRLMTLAQEVKDYVSRGDLELGHAKVLLALEGSVQVEAAKIVIAKGLSVRETEQLIKKLQSPAQPSHAEKRAVDPDIRSLQNRLSETLGSQVKINHTNRGSGKVVIHYNTLDELDGILEHIQ